MPRNRSSYRSRAPGDFIDRINIDYSTAIFALFTTATDESDSLGWRQSNYFETLAAVLAAAWSVAIADLIYPKQPAHGRQLCIDALLK